MRKLIVYQVDAFTTEKLKGNPAGVVINADGLGEREMQMIARELNNSETAFIFSSNDTSYDGIIRYFTPTKEVPICGHATIGAMYALAQEKNLDSCVLRMKTEVGILPFEVIKEKDDYHIVMTQGQFSLSKSLSKEVVNDIYKAIGISVDEADLNCPVQIASTGHSKVMIGIKSRSKLNNLKPDLGELSRLSSKINCNGYFVFTFDSDTPDVLVYGRMFAPAIGINEDPVTGNANGPLGGYLVKNGIVHTKGDSYSFKARQGETINRLGSMEVNVGLKNGEPDVIRIKGNAVVAFKTEI
ncbi:PhzF family isomerase [Segatella paludivivens]|uniref:PhzF family isomerase n=1 Tax=Segatella paludivivens TaxID=185294 RepID=UPI000381B102|nr:PhzF family isomerase [Segatella paludivivens]